MELRVEESRVLLKDARQRNVTRSQEQKIDESLEQNESSCQNGISTTSLSSYTTTPIIIIISRPWSQIQYHTHLPSRYLQFHTSPLPLRRFPRLDRRPLNSPRLLRRPLPYIPAPASQDTHDFRRNGDGKRDADEDEGFVYCVGES